LLGTLGVWRSLVARFVRDEEVVGSNPATPTRVSADQGQSPQRETGPDPSGIRGSQFVSTTVEMLRAPTLMETWPPLTLVVWLAALALNEVR
jgi:hypothetical protein